MAFRPASRSSSDFGALKNVAGIGRQHDLVGVFRIVQRVVEPRHHARRVAERRMRRDVLHPLAVDVDRAIVAQRIEVFRAGLRGAGG
jgi:hypothetical protein